jgi:serine/threonine protein kinase
LRRWFPPKTHHHEWDGLVVENGLICFHQELNYDQPIAKGSFGTIYRGTYCLCPYDQPKRVLDVAVKDVADCHSHAELANLVELKEESEIVHLYNYYEEGQHALFVLELCRGGDLIDYMLKRGRPLLEKEVRPIIRWLLKAIQKCHDHKICHADLKLDNIGLVEPNDLSKLKLLDFGKSHRLQSGPYRTEDLRGSPHYVAPELFRREWLEDILPIDAWCIGVITFMLLANHFPFLDAKEILRKQPKFDGSSEAVDFLTCLLDKNPATRMTVKQALEHPWIYLGIAT